MAGRWNNSEDWIYEIQSVYCLPLSIFFLTLFLLCCVSSVLFFYFFIFYLSCLQKLPLCVFVALLSTTMKRAVKKAVMSWAVLINWRTRKKNSVILRSSLGCLGRKELGNTVASFSVRAHKAAEEEVAVVKTRRWSRRARISLVMLFRQCRSQPTGFWVVREERGQTAQESSSRFKTESDFSVA